MTEPSLGRLLAGSSGPESFLQTENGKSKETFDPVDQLLGRLLKRACSGHELVEATKSKASSTLRVLGLSAVDEQLVSERFSPDAQQARGAWWLADSVSLRPAVLNLPAALLAGNRFPGSLAGEDSLKVELDTAHHLFVFAVLQPAMVQLLLPLELRGASSGKKDADTRRLSWQRCADFFDAIHLDAQSLEALRNGRQWSAMKLEDRNEAKRLFLQGIAASVSDDTARRYRATVVSRLITKFYAKAKDGSPLQRSILTKALQPDLAAYFGGSWLEFLDYVGEDPSPSEEIMTSLPLAKLFVGGSQKVNEIAATKGIDPIEVERMLASFYGGSSSKSPVERRVDVCRKYWNAFDAVHARQEPGMTPLWGFVDDGDSLLPGLEGEPYQPQVRESLLSSDLSNEIESLWGTMTLARWPERIVGTTHPHAAFADAFGVALEFWHGCALTTWFLCEGPYSRTNLSDMAAYYERRLAALAELECPVNPALFSDLVAAESGLGKPIPITVDESSVNGVQISVNMGSQRSGFQVLRDIVTGHRRAWTEQFFNSYMRARWETELKELSFEFNRFLAAKGKAPTAKQFLKFANTPVNHWFGGNMADAYAAFGEKPPIDQLTVSLMPVNRSALARLVYAGLGGLPKRIEYSTAEAELYNKQRLITRQAQAATKFVQLEEALDRPPTPKELNAERWDESVDIDALWPSYTAAIKMALPKAAAAVKTSVPGQVAPDRTRRIEAAASDVISETPVPTASVMSLLKKVLRRH